jgi:predicted ribonuclease YlaK
MKRLRIDHLLTYDPITANQRTAYEAWNEQDHLVLCGSAGTGKTFIGMYLALQDVLDKSYSQDKLVIVRSVVPTREMGYLPGSIEEKVDAYTETDKSGILNFMNIMEVMNNFTTVEFGWPDIVRSDFVRDYIMTKEMVERGKIK